MGAVLISLAISYLAGNLTNGQLIIYILIASCIGFPIFIMLVGYLIWLINYKARQRTFSKFPFNQIDRIGFAKANAGNTSKLSFAYEIWEGELNGFILFADLSKEKGRHFIEFEILFEGKNLDRSELNRITEKFKKHNAELRIGSMVKTYDTRQHSLSTVLDLKYDLELFTTKLRQEGFEPKS
jgi:hypothetical protein